MVALFYWDDYNEAHIAEHGVRVAMRSGWFSTRGAGNRPKSAKGSISCGGRRSGARTCR